MGALGPGFTRDTDVGASLPMFIADKRDDILSTDSGGACTSFSGLRWMGLQISVSNDCVNKMLTF